LVNGAVVIGRPRGPWFYGAAELGTPPAPLSNHLAT
jgi:hypothetical protein